MATQSAPRKLAAKTVEQLSPTRLKELAGTVNAADKTVKSVSGAIDTLKDAGGKVFGKKGKGQTANKVKITNIIEEIDVGAPRRLVYDQWTQFQEFPSFTKKVESTEQAGDEKVHWKAKILWSTRSWESTIVEQVPDERVVWRSKGAKGYVDGAVTFHELTPDLTRVLLVLEYHPQGLFERTGNLWRAQGRRARLELKHFQRHVMTQTLPAKDGVEGWRGEIRDSEVVKSHDDDAAAEEKQQRGGRGSGGSNRSRKSSAGGRSSGTKRSSGSRSGARSSSDEQE
jgi:uncharacterized membrane protein